MRKINGWCLGLLLLAAPAGAAEPKGKLVQETWDAAYLDGNRAGYAHLTVHEADRDGRKVLRSTLVFDLTLKRFKDTMHARMEQSTEETPEGQVTAVGMTQTLGRNQVMVLTGTVTGKQLHVKVEGQYQMDKKIPWNEKVIGLYREHQIFKDRRAKPGDRFSYLKYEPTLNAVFKVDVEVKEPEEVEVGGMKQRLLRAEGVSEKIQGVQVPRMVYWLDRDLQVVRSESELPGLGKTVMVRSTRDVALAKASAKIDVGESQLIALGSRILRAQDTSSVVYKITLPGDDDAGTAFAKDNRQAIRNVRGETFELHVKAVREPQKTADPDAKAPAEFLRSNYFINCDDARVKDHARKAIGKETDPWKKALLVERWVNRNMKILNFSQAMATADHVAETLEGDCTEYAMLAAAMCRAAGVPSRVAVGLVYVDNSAKGPALAYHMWTEVWAQGQWLTLDATLGRGSVGAAHLKITDHSWHDTESLKPLLPVMRVTLKKPKVEVLSVNGTK